MFSFLFVWFLFSVSFSHSSLTLPAPSHSSFFFVLPKVAKVDETKHCNHVHLFTDKNFHDPTRSLNHQMAQSELLKQRPDVFLTSHRCDRPSPLSSPAEDSSVTFHSEPLVCSFHSTARLRFSPPRIPAPVPPVTAVRHQSLQQPSLTSGGLCQDPKRPLEAAPPPSSHRRRRRPPLWLSSCRRCWICPLQVSKIFTKFTVTMKSPVY